MNGRPKKWTNDTISYSEMLNLAFNNNPPTGDGIIMTVTYSRGVDRAQDNRCGVTCSSGDEIGAATFLEAHFRWRQAVSKASRARRGKSPHSASAGRPARRPSGGTA